MSLARCVFLTGKSFNRKLDEHTASVAAYQNNVDSYQNVNLLLLHI